MSHLMGAVTLSKQFFMDHKDEITSIVNKYGDDAWDVIIAMIKNKKRAEQEFAELLNDKSANELLDIAISEFEVANQSKKRAQAFVNDVGKGLGIILKAALKSVIPIL